VCAAVSQSHPSQSPTSKSAPQSPKAEGRSLSARQLAVSALRQIHQGGYADVVADRILGKSGLEGRDRRLFTELVYGAVRRMRTLDAVIDNLAKKPATQQPPNLRSVLHIGLYQILFLDHIPSSAAVDTTVELAKANGLAGLAGFVNGVLRRLVRELEKEAGEEREEDIAGDFGARNAPPVRDGEDLGRGTIDRLLGNELGVVHSFPDWLVDLWVGQFGEEEAEALCEWMNEPPHLDLRIGRRGDIVALEAAFEKLDVVVGRIESVPGGLRLSHSPGPIQELPGFAAGEWMVQDASAQLVGFLVDPQPGEIIADLCAAPGGKSVHLAELMTDRGRIIAVEKTGSRLKKIKQNCDRLGITSIELVEGDARELRQWDGLCDRVLVDAPCSGLGTLNRHADARWRQTPESIAGLAILQGQILASAARWVKPGGKLVYSTCTLHPDENEGVVQTFLDSHSEWTIDPVEPSNPVFPLLLPEGWVRVLPHQQNMDGFFMVRLRKNEA
jgi:16S rRNA (cytosine967-C5)-methyltransferase